MGVFDSQRGNASKPFEPPVASIEAGLAIRRQATSGKKSRLPQKEMAPKVKPSVTGVAMDPSAVPSKDTTKDVPPSMVDPEAVFEKYRQAAAAGEAAAEGDPGKDEENRRGVSEGSEWGTVEDAKGDPYVAELVGRMTTSPEIVVPSVVTQGAGLLTQGCVRLDERGKIVFRGLGDSKSPSHAFNSAVEKRLAITPDMEQPVPEHVKDLLVVQGICVPFRY